jgi:hypothetical protein
MMMNKKILYLYIYMLPFIIIGILLICCCSSSSFFPAAISSSVSFADLRESGTFKRAKEHFNSKK